MSPSNLDLFRRNGLVNKEGQICGVLRPPVDQDALRDALAPMMAEAVAFGVMLRVGVQRHTEPEVSEFLVSELLVYAVDLGRPNDEYGVLRRLAALLAEHGVEPLPYDIDTEDIWEMAEALVKA